MEKYPTSCILLLSIVLISVIAYYKIYFWMDCEKILFNQWLSSSYIRLLLWEINLKPIMSWFYFNNRDIKLVKEKKKNIEENDYLKWYFFLSIMFNIEKLKRQIYN